MQVDNILFRASQVANIMHEPKLKADKESGLLSATAQTYCKQLYREIKYGRKKGLVNKYVEKGIYNEDQAIDMLSEFENKFYVKNEEHFSNEYIKGTPDIITDIITDIKCSFDLFTFPFKDDPINDTYYWQMQCYMALTGKQKARLVYVLTDTPEFLIRREKQNFMFRVTDEPKTESLEEIFAKIEREMKFEDIPLSERICIFEVEKNDNDISRVYSQVEKCRKYLATL